MKVENGKIKAGGFLDELGLFAVFLLMVLFGWLAMFGGLDVLTAPSQVGMDYCWSAQPITNDLFCYDEDRVCDVGFNGEEFVKTDCRIRSDLEYKMKKYSMNRCEQKVGGWKHCFNLTTVCKFNQVFPSRESPTPCNVL